jgi:nucleotide-binding universal stress UspA family protein
MIPFQNILVAVDFGDTDKALLAHALQMAEKFNAGVWIIHVAMPDPEFVGYEVGPQYIRDVRAEDLRAEHKTLKNYANDFKDAGIEAEALLVQGYTAETLLEEVKKLKIDLFVMGVHKQGFLDRLFSENNPSQLALKSRVPLLLVP